jgi:Fe-S cluster biogenesis protein NfuA
MPEWASRLDDLLDRMEELLAAVEKFEPHVRDQVFELLDCVDTLHRNAITELAEELGDEVKTARAKLPAADWLFGAYGVGVDESELATRALDDIRPYIHGHGGQVEVLAVHDGVVRVRLSGACCGCTASAETLKEGVQKALSAGFPGFVRLEVIDDNRGAAAHPPPGPTLLQIQRRPA